MQISNSVLNQINVSFSRLNKAGIKSATPGLRGEWFIHYTIRTPNNSKYLPISHTSLVVNLLRIYNVHIYVWLVICVKCVQTYNSVVLTLCIRMDFPILIDTLSMGLTAAHCVL